MIRPLTSPVAVSHLKLTPPSSCRTGKLVEPNLINPASPYAEFHMPALEPLHLNIGKGFRVLIRTAYVLSKELVTEPGGIIGSPDTFCLQLGPWQGISS